MSGTVWSKFFWSDWDTDPALKLCSYAAQGLWMRMLCVAAAHDPIGYVAVAGRALDETSIARMTGGQESEVRALLGELDRNGVFSRDRQGRIYSRRMVSDARRAATAKKNGKKGGNPNLSKDTENQNWDNPPDKGGLKPHKPSANIQTEEREANASPVGSVDLLFVESAGDQPEPRRAKPTPWKTNAAFQAFWLASGPQMRTRASQEKVWPEWRRVSGETGPEALIAALKRYMAEDKDYLRGTGGPGLHSWLKDGRWEHWLPSAGPARPSMTAKRFPDEAIRAAVLAHDPDTCLKWLDNCNWLEADRVIVPPNSFVGEKLAQGAGPVLRTHGISAIRPAVKDAA